MKKIFLALALSFLPIQAHAQVTPYQAQTDINTNIATGKPGGYSALDVRNTFNDFLGALYLSVNPTTGALTYFNGTTFVPYTIGNAAGDVSGPYGALIVNSTHGVPFAPSATIDATNANNITSGVLSGAIIPAFTGGACTSTVGTLSISCPGYAAKNAANSFTVTQTFLNWQIVPVAVAALPTCNAGAKGTVATVSDATSPAYNATLVGSGAITVLAFCNGTNWTAH